MDDPYTLFFLTTDATLEVLNARHTVLATTWGTDAESPIVREWMALVKSAYESIKTDIQKREAESTHGHKRIKLDHDAGSRTDSAGMHMEAVEGTRQFWNESRAAVRAYWSTVVTHFMSWIGEHVERRDSLLDELERLTTSGSAQRESTQNHVAASTSLPNMSSSISLAHGPASVPVSTSSVGDEGTSESHAPVALTSTQAPATNDGVDEDKEDMSTEAQLARMKRDLDTKIDDIKQRQRQKKQVIKLASDLATLLLNHQKDLGTNPMRLTEEEVVEELANLEYWRSRSESACTKYTTTWTAKAKDRHRRAVAKLTA